LRKNLTGSSLVRGRNFPLGWRQAIAVRFRLTAIMGLKVFAKMSAVVSGELAGSPV
jgi:hypothetical protein